MRALRPAARTTSEEGTMSHRSVRAAAALAFALLLALPLMAQAQGAPAIKVTADPKLGNILTDGQGKTLYMYTRDDTNVSNCYDACEQRWPVLTVPSGAQPSGTGLNGTLGTTTRKDG